ncbi:50S ribosomal protein L4 [Candidatus Gottesmanbacteria bacterium]|nr:50S ribosomal protein L4 [Candidatus Gottesmanbacteria bacterium]
MPKKATTKSKQPSRKPRKANKKDQSPKPTAHETAPKSVSTSVVGVDGKVKGRVQLPAELFAAKVNKQLLAQAVRVYLANQRQGTASTKTRGEVEGSTRKIYRQKGTGRARHGAIRAPIFVGGGIVFGPKPRDYSLKIPQKMRRRAVAAALTSTYQDGHLVVVDGLSELEPKTKQFAAFFTAIGVPGKTLIVVPTPAADVVRGVRNLPFVDVLAPQNLNAYALLSHNQTVVMKEALPLLGIFRKESDRKKTVKS